MRESRSRIPRLHRWLLLVAGVLVPRGRREAWRREWEGEIAHRASRIEGLASTGLPERDLLEKTRGAFVDAFWFFLQELREGFFLDLRQGLRGMARRPAFTLFVLVTLAIGIGANVALFSIVNGVLLKPLPYDEPEQLVVLWETSGQQGVERTDCSPGDYQYWRDHNDLFTAIGAWYLKSLTVQTEQDAVMYDAAQVSAGFFPVLGTAPAYGRYFTQEEVDRAVHDSSNTLTGEAPVVILSHRLWKQRFASDRSIVGRTITIERQPYEVVGVMPAGFSYPHGGIDLWVPWSFAHERPRDQRYVNVIARLKPGIPLARAESAMTGMSADMAREFPATNEGWTARLTPLHEETTGPVRPALLMLLGAVACVLLIVCINVAGLLLVRATGRHHEIAIRSAMGASRVRLVRQLMTESLSLSFVGGGLGLAAAWWVIGSFETFGPPGLPRIHDLRLDTPALVFAVAVATAAGVISGIIPALAGSRSEASSVLKDDGSRSATASPRRQRLRDILVVSEVALATLLLAGAGLMVRSFSNLTSVDPGFSPDNVLVFPIILDGASYTGEKSRAYYRNLVETLEEIPGVESAGGSTVLPLSPVGPDFHLAVWPEGAEHPPEGGGLRADVRMATPGYFGTMKMEIIQGRDFTAEDHQDAPRKVIINETLARQHWPGVNPVGRRLMVDYTSRGVYPYEVVGVVNDVRFYGLKSRPRAEMYQAHSQRPYLIMNMAVRTRTHPEGMIPMVRQAVLKQDPGRPVHSIVPMSDYLKGSIDNDRFTMLLLTGFAAVALGLAAIGIYGVLSLRVSQRLHEIGVRMALGAERKDVMTLFVGQGARLVFTGLALGVLASLGATRLLSGLLFGVSPADPVTFLAVALILAIVGLAACWIPARRATRIDPLVALRHV